MQVFFSGFFKLNNRENYYNISIKKKKIKALNFFLKVKNINLYFFLDFRLWISEIYDKNKIIYKF